MKKKFVAVNVIIAVLLILLSWQQAKAGVFEDASNWIDDNVIDPILTFLGLRSDDQNENQTGTPSVTSSSPQINTTLNPVDMTLSQNTNITYTPQNIHGNDLFNESKRKTLMLVVPGYAYFQGLVYTNGNFKAIGHIRVIGGIIAYSQEGAGTSRSIYIKDGAMLTSCPEYLRQYITGGKNSVVIIKWEEVPAGQ